MLPLFFQKISCSNCGEEDFEGDKFYNPCMLDFSFEEMHRLTSLVKRHLLMMFPLFESNLEGYLSLSWISLVCFIQKIELYKLLQFNYL
ncbi:unnamed protein product, partial [Vitis vinifera]